MRNCVREKCLKEGHGDYPKRKELQPESLTSYGEWIHTTVCDEGELANAYEFTYDPMNGGDDNGATGFRIKCQPEDQSSLRWIGHTGYTNPEWTKAIMWQCPDNWYLNAIQVNSEEDQGGSSIFQSGDDMALTNVRLWCKNPNDPTSMGEIMNEGPGHMPSDARWTDKKTCPKYYGIMGLKLKIEKEQGSGDDTALNKIIVYCEPIIDYMSASIDDRN